MLVVQLMRFQGIYTNKGNVVIIEIYVALWWVIALGFEWLVRSVAIRSQP
jgi:hypothetical protein